MMSVRWPSMGLIARFCLVAALIPLISCDSLDDRNGGRSSATAGSADALRGSQPTSPGTTAAADEAVSYAPVSIALGPVELASYGRDRANAVALSNEANRLIQQIRKAAASEGESEPQREARLRALRELGIRGCDLDGGNDARDSHLGVPILRAYVALLASDPSGSPADLVDQINAVQDTCFKADGTHFSTTPAFLFTDDLSFFDMPKDYANAVSRYQRAAGRDLIADAYAYRASLDSENLAKVCPASGSLNVTELKLGLWAQCKGRVQAGKSCLSERAECPLGSRGE
jgi:hypothetical protein